MSNRVEAVIAMLAVTSIGAIWTGALPTLGASVKIFSAYYFNRISVHVYFLWMKSHISDNSQSVLHNLWGFCCEIRDVLYIFI